ncbi:MAG: PfkB family carbohydrate kinase [Candidatus Limiplasma sp.]|nr:PfkB family carbohydrate kinase [Candidatus Limiplasma sp.]
MKYFTSIDGKALRYQRLLATGGIGTGLFFALEGNHTLGRNESRLGALLPHQDYCKQHVITHYVAVLLGGAQGRFTVHAMGKVGQDAPGRALIAQMRRAGIQTEAVVPVAEAPTLQSICFQYPDASGGNITSSNSASAQVAPEDIHSALAKIPRDGVPEMMLAAPEVPVEARAAMLAAGRERGALNVASVLSGEVEAFTRQGLWKSIDLLAVNIDEAAAIAAMDAQEDAPEQICGACRAWLRQRNPAMRILVSNGAKGCYGMEGCDFQHLPAIPLKAVSTAGAGDALLAGAMAGLCLGLPLLRPPGEQAYSCAVDVGILLAAFSVTSPHTIHPQADAQSLACFAQSQGISYAPAFAALLQNTLP